MLITIYGRVPSKKNGKRLLKNLKTDKYFIGSSTDYLEWQEDAMIQLLPYINKWTCSLQYELICTFYSDSNIKFDLSNKFESVADVLVDRGLIDDDNYKILPKVTLIYGGFDKKNPRVEIEVININIENELKKI